MLDHLDASGRYALLKLALGELRVGINARLAKQALAQAFGLEVEAVEEVWHGLRPPFTELFDWAEGRGDQPTVRDVPVFRPFMLAHPLDDTKVSLDDYVAEWKWDGIRVQLVHAGGDTRLYSRTGDDISGSFPDVAEAFRTPQCSTVSCWSAARHKALAWGSSPPPASMRCSNGSAARMSARTCSAPTPPSSGSTISCSTATRICAS
jgi:ATP-dependent DNA ligase